MHQRKIINFSYLTQIPLDEKIEIKKKEVNFFTAVLVDNVCRALRNGYPTAIVELKQLLLKGKITSRSIDEHGCSILHAACQGGLVIDIFQKGYGFELDKKGNTPLHIAHLFCHKDLIHWLISRGQNPHIQNRIFISQNLTLFNSRSNPDSCTP